MNLAQRRELVDRRHHRLSIVAAVPASTTAPRRDLTAGPVPDERDRRQYLETPFYGSRRMRACLERQGKPVTRKRVQRLMRAMGLRAIYRRPGTSRRSPEHPVNSHLLRNAKNQSAQPEPATA